MSSPLYDGTGSACRSKDLPYEDSFEDVIAETQTQRAAIGLLTTRNEALANQLKQISLNLQSNIQNDDDDALLGEALHSNQGQGDTTSDLIELVFPVEPPETNKDITAAPFGFSSNLCESEYIPPEKPLFDSFTKHPFDEEQLYSEYANYCKHEDLFGIPDSDSKLVENRLPGVNLQAVNGEFYRENFDEANCSAGFNVDWKISEVGENIDKNVLKGQNTSKSIKLAECHFVKDDVATSANEGWRSSVHLLDMPTSSSSSNWFTMQTGAGDMRSVENAKNVANMSEPKNDANALKLMSEHLSENVNYKATLNDYSNDIINRFQPSDNVELPHRVNQILSDNKMLPEDKHQALIEQIDELNAQCTEQRRQIQLLEGDLLTEPVAQPPAEDQLDDATLSLLGFGELPPLPSSTPRKRETTIPDLPVDNHLLNYKINHLEHKINVLIEKELSEKSFPVTPSKLPPYEAHKSHSGLSSNHWDSQDDQLIHLYEDKAKLTAELEAKSVECEGLKREITDVKRELSEYERELKKLPGLEREYLRVTDQLEAAEQAASEALARAQAAEKQLAFHKEAELVQVNAIENQLNELSSAKSAEFTLLMEQLQSARTQNAELKEALNKSFRSSEPTPSITSFQPSAIKESNYMKTKRHSSIVDNRTTDMITYSSSDNDREVVPKQVEFEYKVNDASHSKHKVTKRKKKKNPKRVDHDDQFGKVAVFNRLHYINQKERPHSPPRTIWDDNEDHDPQLIQPSKLYSSAEHCADTYPWTSTAKPAILPETPLPQSAAYEKSLERVTTTLKNLKVRFLPEPTYDVKEKTVAENLRQLSDRVNSIKTSYLH